MRKLKKDFPENERLAQSELIFSHLENQEYFKNAKIILAYWSMNDEVHTHSFIEKAYKNKNILLPSVNGDDLLIKEYKGIESMVPGEHFGILEPSGPIFSEESKIDLIIVPGVAFDAQNKRMGRGRGYYDKLLKNSHAIKIGICFDFQFFENIPAEPHDVAMDYVIKS
ncbi:MAG: 5-formyltetrahydrofolate cyclo-ligase [Salinivirgaceae bacterium]|nr:5-formyltetrahydrofolate cyclo-ligase [Salinivirgaceae bacterium]